MMNIIVCLGGKFNYESSYTCTGPLCRISLPSLFFVYVVFFGVVCNFIYDFLIKVLNCSDHFLCDRNKINFTLSYCQSRKAPLLIPDHFL